MDLIYTNSSMQAIGVMKAYDLDLAFGSDENDFEIKVDANNHCCEAGYYVYIIGTEYGGVIDAVTSDTETGEVTYTGRTWHGILNSKVICPDAGQDYLTLNSEANGVLNSLITRMGLTSIFTVNIYASDLEISNYKMPRYVTGYDGIMQMLKSVNGKLVLSFDGEKVILSAAPIADHTKDGSVSSDAMSLQVKKTSKKINHLICLGQGELKDRTVVHLYADASGSISQTQTLTGADEYAAVYDYPSAESTQKLIADGTSRLAELQKQDDLSVSLNEAEYAFDVGDVVGAVDTVTGISVSVPITKKIISIRNDYMSVSYETAIGKNGTSSSGSSGVSGGGADISTVLDKVYPIGSIYVSVSSTNPKTLFGGTWVQIKDRFLLAAGMTYKAGATGGEATHTLTVDEIPNHQHVLWYPNEGGEQSAAIGYPEAGSKNTWYAEASKTGGAGGGGAHNNMPPYLAVYIWKRTA